MLPRVTGVAVHDSWAPYRHYACRHALCSAHHLRELTTVEERTGQAWATAMKRPLVENKEHVAARRAAGAAASSQEARAGCTAPYRRLLAEDWAANPPPAAVPGKRGRPKQGKTRSLLDRLTRYEEEVLRFPHDWRVPFDNNQAERDLRMRKVQQKVSGTFRNDEGARAFCRLRCYLFTRKKQGQHALTALEQVFHGQPLEPAYG